MTKNVKEKMTIREVADLLDMSEESVYRWTKSGLRREPEKVIGRKAKYIVRLDDLLNYFNAETLEELLEMRRNADDQ